MAGWAKWAARSWCRGGASVAEADLLAWSRENMANYKVPRQFVFVDDLPRNAAGKVLKTELRDGVKQLRGTWR
jgi:acyl-CoA synthetase (AMP-forming)/AMP-acid ligase II